MRRLISSVLVTAHDVTIHCKGGAVVDSARFTCDP